MPNDSDLHPLLIAAFVVVVVLVNVVIWGLGAAFTVWAGSTVLRITGCG